MADSFKRREFMTGDDEVVNTLTRAAEFMATHARLLDRRRFELLFGDGSTVAALAALAAYRQPDGGYGIGLEPDLRSDSSQPLSALHAFEVFEEIGRDTSPEAVKLCDWLGSVTLVDGGLPFALPIPDPAGCAPFFVDVDPTESSLHMTAMLAGIAHRVGRHDTGVRDHPWLVTATDYAMRHIRAMRAPGHALEFRYCLQMLDALVDTSAEARVELRRLGEFLPSSGPIPVDGGIEGEAMHLLDFAPVPERPIRNLFPATAVRDELDRLMTGQQDDGGWTVDWQAHSPASAVEWRGWSTVRALKILRDNHRLTRSD
ncbi:hypothetical protein [Phytoactinopolyspora limicola]|uniref:hypothetical protein n=1 Tax=Phytoactinopolyspora limicola TaxID=2715536 RepID=UPI001A9CAD6D|nr:hypothetical protein [Phytoactinopolyspora limicola]